MSSIQQQEAQEILNNLKQLSTKVKVALDGPYGLDHDRLSNLSDVIIEEIENQKYKGIRYWLTEHTGGKNTNTEKGSYLASEITSKKGELPENTYNITSEAITYVPYGIKMAIPSHQGVWGNNPGTEDTAMALAKFVSTISNAFIVGESCVFFNKIYELKSSTRKYPLNVNITADLLNSAFAKIEKEQLIVEQIIMGTNQYAGIRCFGKDFYDEATNKERRTTGLYGHLWTSDIRVLPSKGFNNMVFLGNKKDRPAVQYSASDKNPTITYSFIKDDKNFYNQKHVFEIRGLIGVVVDNWNAIEILNFDESN